ncbi:aldehyde dehydrogenase [Rhodococcus opacus]|uniref:aldehyde dehydrogenase n=1 Tax=Rhodococcus opacus TaxID=37919 RepID=UPI00155B121F|nr:aldehyde dehydrogenase [Rhodococcus opacus]
MHRHSMVKHPTKLFIDGAWIDPDAPGSSFAVLNSGTEEVFETIAAADRADAKRAVAAARAAFDSGPWPKLSHAERGAYLNAIATELDRLADQQAVIWTTEAGIVHHVARPRMERLGGAYRYYADLADNYPFEERHKLPDADSVALHIREPVGVVAAIVPWNAAPGLMATKVAPALLAGCTVIIKASPEAPCSAYLLAEACETAGLPPGVVNVLTADRDVSEDLIRNPDVDKVSFTGSTAAGRRIASICGERIARCTLELGGKSPALVLDDFDLEDAARTITSRATFLTGQFCYSTSRIIVSRDRHDELVEALSSAFAAVKVGDPFDSTTDMGPLATGQQRARVENYINIGVSEGAQLAFGGRRPTSVETGFFVEPTVFGRVDNRSTIAREEIFGPVLAVVAAKDESDAIDLANDSIYGLNAAIFTNDSAHALDVARQLRCGAVGHKRLGNEQNVAFGGFKQSGIGREVGREGLAPYLESKVVVLDNFPDAVTTAV